MILPSHKHLLDKAFVLGKDRLVDPASDSVLRALTDDGSFRVITARTSQTVQGAARAQSASGSALEHFADLITGTILVRETMAPQLRVQGIVRGAGQCGSLVADSHPGGAARGLVQIAAGKSEFHTAGGFLQMMRTLHDGRIHQGIVEIPREGGISAGMMQYMQISEQVTAVAVVGSLLQGDQILEAGGYIVQLLPEAKEGMLAVMTERLADFPSMTAILGAKEFSPSTLTEELLYGMPYTKMEESPLRFECICSEVRILSGLASLKASEIQSLLEEKGMLDITCDFCKKHYELAPEMLRGLLNSN